MSLSVKHISLIISCLGWHPLGEERFSSPESRRSLFNDVLEHYKIQCLAQRIDYIEPSEDAVIGLCLQHANHLVHINRSNQLAIKACEIIHEYEDSRLIF